MTESFFDNSDDNEQWNQLSNDYEIEIQKALRPIFARAREKKHSIRGLQLLVSYAGLELGCMYLTGFVEREKKRAEEKKE